MLLALGSGLPAIAIVTALLWRSPLDPSLRSLVVFALWLGWLICAALAVERAVRPMQTLSNMMAAIRAGDTSIRARHADPEGALGLALWEINALTGSVREQRLGAIAATALLQRVMDSVDVAGFGFDTRHRLRVRERGGGGRARGAGGGAARAGGGGARAGPPPRRRGAP